MFRGERSVTDAHEFQWRFRQQRSVNPSPASADSASQTNNKKLARTGHESSSLYMMFINEPSGKVQRKKADTLKSHVRVEVVYGRLRKFKKI